MFVLKSQILHKERQTEARAARAFTGCPVSGARVWARGGRAGSLPFPLMHGRHLEQPPVLRDGEPSEAVCATGALLAGLAATCPAPEVVGKRPPCHSQGRNPTP